MEGTPQNNNQEKQLQTTAITPEILGKDENIPSLEKTTYTSKIRVFTFVTDFFDDWFSTQAKSKNIDFSMEKRILDPAESEITLKLKGKSKDISELISETNNYLKKFPRP